MNNYDLFLVLINMMRIKKLATNRPDKKIINAVMRKVSNTFSQSVLDQDKAIHYLPT